MRQNVRLLSIAALSMAMSTIALFAPATASAAPSARLMNPVCGFYRCDEDAARAECEDELSIAKQDPGLQPWVQGLVCYHRPGSRKFNIAFPSGQNLNLNEYQNGFAYGIDPPILPAGNLGCPDQCAAQAFGDPIDAGTGNKFETHTAYVGNGVFPLRLALSYNSIRTPAYFPGSLRVFGRNRTHTYLRRVDVYASTTGTRAYVTRPNGKVIRFVLSGSNWVPDRLGVGTLEQIALPGGGQGWRFVDNGGNVDRFDAAGRLTVIEEASGFIQQLAYDAQGRLISVIDPEGRALTFEYAASGLVQRVVLPDGRDLQFQYNTSKDLVRMQYADGTATQYLYDETAHVAAGSPKGLLTGVLDESGQRYATTTYIKPSGDTEAKATGTVLAGGVDAQSAQYQWAASNLSANSATVTLPLGATRQLSFILRGGVALASSVVESCVGCTTSTVSYTYDTSGQLDIETRNGVTTDVDHNARGLETRRIEAANDTTGRKRTLETDWHPAFRSPTERRTYDAAGALKAKTGWSYNARNQPTVVTRTDPVTAATRTTSMQYCEQADVDADDCPFVGLLKSIDGPRSDVNDSVTYVYRLDDAPACATAPTTCAWREGDLWKVVNALGQTLEILAYDGAGRPLRSRDINGVITDREYDARGRLTASKTRGTDDTVETDDRIQRISYWPIGQVRRVTQPDGAYLEYGYDAAQRLVSVQDNLGNRIDYTLNAAGQRTAEQVRDPGNTLRRSLSRSYNSLAQLIQATDADNHSTSFTYDANGNADLTTDALGRVTNANHDPLQRLRQSLQDTAGINANTQFAYDERDNLTRVTDPKGLNTDYSYNGFDELVQLNSPDTGTTTYAYDPAGNRTQQTDARGVVTQYAYDALQRITSLSYPSDSTRNVTYAYDTAQSDCPTADAFLAGRLSRMTDASGSTTYCYNRYGDLTRKVQRTNGQLLALRWESGVDGRVQRMVYPNGAEADYAYDTLGRVVEIGVKPTATAAREVLLNQATYAPFGPVTGWVYGNGLAMRRPVDLDYQPQAVEVLHTDGQGVQTAVGLRLGYIFDAVGNLLRLEDSRSPGTVKRRFGYDGLDRLASMRKADEELLQSYTYDATGNRIAMTELIPVFDGAPGGGGTTTYQTINHTYTYPASSHRLTAVDGVPRSYDAAGNLIQLGDATMPGGPRDFGYDASNRMAQMSRLSQVKASYAYNGAGERVRKTTPGGVETYSLHDPAGRWVGDYDGSGQPIQQAVWFGDLPVGVIATVPATAGQTQQKLFHLQPDMLGTPRVVVDPSRGATGTVVWTWDLEGEAFGSEPAQADPDGDGVAFQLDMRFPGQRIDGTTGLHYNYFRDYESGTGRYVQSDPIGLEGDISTYGYAISNPASATDFYGLQVAPPLPWVQPIAAPRPITTPIDPFIGITPGTPKDPMGEYCRSVMRKILNTKDEIYNKRWPDLLENLLNLPWRIGPGEKLRETRRGHEKLLNRRLRELRNLEDEYDMWCRGPIACTADDAPALASS